MSKAEGITNADMKVGISSIFCRSKGTNMAVSNANRQKVMGWSLPAMLKGSDFTSSVAGLGTTML